MSLSVNLRRLMEEKGWGVPHLMAAMSDAGVAVNQWAVERWLEGRNAPRAALIPVIAVALGCTPNDLFAEADSKAVSNA